MLFKTMHKTNHSRPFLLLLVTAILLLANEAAAERTYTDSKGDTFTFKDDQKPRIVSNVIGALSLFHLGLESDQLVAIYDHWMVRGSTIDMDDPSQEFDSEFAIDPNAEEVAFLEQAVNLSPPEKCRDASGGCWNEIGEEELAGLGEESYDFVVMFRTGNGGASGIEEALGKKIIFIDYKYEHNQGCYGTGEDRDSIVSDENCWSMSLIDAVRELEKFADFLGIEASSGVVQEKQNMCRAASEFVEHAKTLHDKGIYAHAISLRPFNGLTMSWFSPITFPWLRTLEELGMPIVHPPSTPWQKTTEEWFVEGTETPSRPVDLWLLDSRTYGSVHNFFEDSAGQFPDPAFARGQYTYWQFNDGAISYTNIARYLDDVRLQTSDLERVHSETLQCADVDVTSREFSNKLTGGIQSDDPAGGTFACHGNLQSLYLECPTVEEIEAAAEAEKAEAPGTVGDPGTLENDPSRDEDVAASVSAGIRRYAASTATTVLMVPLVVACVFAS